MTAISSSYVPRMCGTRPRQILRSGSFLYRSDYLSNICGSCLPRRLEDCGSILRNHNASTQSAHFEQMVRWDDVTMWRNEVRLWGWFGKEQSIVRNAVLETIRDCLHRWVAIAHKAERYYAVAVNSIACAALKSAIANMSRGCLPLYGDTMSELCPLQRDVASLGAPWERQSPKFSLPDHAPKRMALRHASHCHDGESSARTGSLSVARGHSTRSFFLISTL
jgi:hypothetical protein